MANVCISKVAPGNPGPDPPAAVTWFEPWRCHVTIELICQGPADPETPDDDPRWEHAGQTVADLVATGYQPIGLS